MDTGEILDSAFGLYRRHFRAFLAAGAVPMSPLLLFWGWLVVAAWQGAALTADQATDVAVLATLAGWLPAVFTRGMAIRMTHDAQTGQPVRPRAAAAAAFRRLPALLWASALTSTIIALPFAVGGAVAAGAVADAASPALIMVVLGLFAVLSAILAAAWFGTLPAVMLEGVSGDDGRGRSWRLARAGAAKVLAVWVVTLLLVWLPWLGVEAMLQTVAGNTEAGMPFAVAALLSQVASAFTIPLVAVARTLLFNDLRVRAEALDVRLAAERLPAAA